MENLGSYGVMGFVRIYHLVSRTLQKLTRSQLVLAKPSSRMTNTFHLCCLGFAHVNAESHRSIIINHLQTSYSLNKDIPCIYIYFDYRKQKSQNLRSLLSSLLVQLLRSRIGISAKIRDIYEAWEHTRIHPSPEHYVEMLKSQMKAIPKVFIVIDALDECLDDTETNTLSSFLGACQELSENAHMLLTSRPGIRFAQMIDATCELVVTADAGDIRKYLNKSINSRDRLRDIIEAELRNDNLFQDKALNTIVAGSQGMQVLSQQSPGILLTLMQCCKWSGWLQI